MGKLNLDRFENLVILHITGKLTDKDTAILSSGISSVFKKERARDYIVHFSKCDMDNDCLTTIAKMRQDHKKDGIKYHLVSSKIPGADTSNIKDLLVKIRTKESVRVKNILEIRQKLTELPKKQHNLEAQIVSLIKSFLNEDLPTPIDVDLLDHKMEKILHEKKKIEEIHAILAEEVAWLLERRKIMKKDYSDEEERIESIKQMIVDQIDNEKITV